MKILTLMSKLYNFLSKKSTLSITKDLTAIEQLPPISPSDTTTTTMTNPDKNTHDFVAKAVQRLYVRNMLLQIKNRLEERYQKEKLHLDNFGGVKDKTNRRYGTLQKTVQRLSSDLEKVNVELMKELSLEQESITYFWSTLELQTPLSSFDLHT